MPYPRFSLALVFCAIAGATFGGTWFLMNRSGQVNPNAPANAKPPEKADPNPDARIRVTSLTVKDSHEFGTFKGEKIFSPNPFSKLVFAKVSFRNESNAWTSFFSKSFKIVDKTGKSVDASFVGCDNAADLYGVTSGSVKGSYRGERVKWEVNKNNDGTNEAKWDLAPGETHTDGLLFVIPFETADPCLEVSDQSVRSTVALTVPETRKTEPSLVPSVPVIKELQRINGLDSSVHTIQFWRGSQYVLSLASGDSVIVDGRATDHTGQIRIWNTENGKEVGKLAGHRAGAKAFLVLPDGKQALSCDSWTLYLWDIEKRSQRKIAEASGLNSQFPVHTEAMSLGGDRVLMGWLGAAPALWNLTLQKQERVLGARHGIRFALSSDGKTAMFAENNGISIWDVERDAELRKLPTPISAWMTPVFSPDGRRALTYDVNFPGIIYMWDVVSGKEIRRFEGHADSVGVAIFSPDGRRVLSGSGGRVDVRSLRHKGKDLSIRLWDADSGKEICWLQGHTHVINCLAFSADGRYVVSGGSDETIRIWKLPE